LRDRFRVSGTRAKARFRRGRKGAFDRQRFQKSFPGGTRGGGGAPGGGVQAGKGALPSQFPWGDVSMGGLRENPWEGVH